jgi:hypothetical protein
MWVLQLRCVTWGGLSERNAPTAGEGVERQSLDTYCVAACLLSVLFVVQRFTDKGK